MADMRSFIVLSLFIAVLLTPSILAHSETSGEAFVRVLSADPNSRTYTFTCATTPNDAELRDWFIRPDDGVQGDDPEEAVFPDRPAGQPLTYTFSQNTFYHVACLVVNSSNTSLIRRGDLHIDLRPSNNWNPKISVLGQNGLSINLQCDPASGATPTWEVLNAKTGQTTNLGTSKQISYTAPYHGLFDFFCTADGNRAPLPVEFFDQGNPYLPDKSGIPDGITTTWIRNNTSPPANTTNSTNSTQPNQTNSSQNTCFTTIQSIPATCQDGSITQDTYNGCRQISCSGPSGSVQVLACDKPDGSSSPQRYEMYQQAVTGAAPKLCLGSACISTNGYATANYPVCIAQNGTNISQPPANTTTPNATTNTTNTTPPPNQGACFSSVQNIPATCTGGSFTSDSWNGCRTLVCATSGSSLQVLACDKSGFFEMYRQAAVGSGISQICLGQTCIGTNGYAKSTTFPICGAGNTTNTTQPPLNTTNGTTNTTNATNTTSANQTCYGNVQTLPASCTGTITQDSYNGCRQLACSNSGGSVQVLACDKPDGSSTPSRVEMYRQTISGTPPTLCLGTACISTNGYATSNYPICGMQNGTNISQPPANTTTPNATTNTTNTTPPGVCYSKLENFPVSCAGGQITSDTFNGCRTVVCSGAGGSLQVLACDKPSISTPQYFEMYKQSQTGAGVKICFGQTCIQDNGYAKSSNYPICTAGTNTTNSSGTPSGNTSSALFSWIEPVEGQFDTPPNYFHLNVAVPSIEQSVQFAEWEIWNNALTERVWLATNTGNLRFHTHAPDGTFQGSRAGTGTLDFSSAYKVRLRYGYANNTYSPWSSWRTFTTSAQTSGTNITWAAAPGFRVERFATGFDVPVHVAFAPQGMYNSIPQAQRPYLYVTELYGKVKVVYQDGSSSVYADNLLNFEPFGSITGGGQMGVVGLYVDDQTGDLFVGMTYVENDAVKNKVVRFNSTNDGRGYSSMKTIIDNLPSAPSHQVEQITKGPDGKLYVNLGDGLNEQYAQSDGILAGKIIRMNLDGSNVEVYAKGFRNPFGADWRPGTGQLYITDNSPNTNDRLIRVIQGHNYLWGAGGNAYVGEAMDLLNVSPVDVEFNPGNAGFPSNLTGRMYVAVGGPIYHQGPTNGKEIWEYTLDNAGSVVGKRHFVRYTGTGYGTPIGMDFGPDGLYFTDIYGEPGFVGLGETEGNIYRVVPGAAGNNSIPVGPFRAGISIIPWYPKNTTSGIEYIFECQGIDGSGNYRYDYNFGNGQQQFNYASDRVGPITYPYTDVNYTVTCTVHDQSTAKSASASMVINPSNYLPEK